MRSINVAPQPSDQFVGFVVHGAARRVAKGVRGIFAWTGQMGLSKQAIPATRSAAMDEVKPPKVGELVSYWQGNRNRTGRVVGVYQDSFDVRWNYGGEIGTDTVLTNRDDWHSL
jgi:hypothetical protein